MLNIDSKRFKDDDSNRHRDVKLRVYMSETERTRVIKDNLWQVTRRHSRISPHFTAFHRSLIVTFSQRRCGTRGKFKGREKTMKLREDKHQPAEDNSRSRVRLTVSTDTRRHTGTHGDTRGHGLPVLQSPRGHFVQKLVNQQLVTAADLQVSKSPEMTLPKLHGGDSQSQTRSL